MCQRLIPTGVWNDRGNVTLGHNSTGQSRLSVRTSLLPFSSFSPFPLFLSLPQLPTSHDASDTCFITDRFLIRQLNVCSGWASVHTLHCAYTLISQMNMYTHSESALQSKIAGKSFMSLCRDVHIYTLYTTAQTLRSMDSCWGFGHLRLTYLTEGMHVFLPACQLKNKKTALRPERNTKKKKKKDVEV